MGAFPRVEGMRSRFFPSLNLGGFLKMGSMGTFQCLHSWDYFGLACPSFHSPGEIDFTFKAQVKCLPPREALLSLLPRTVFFYTKNT